MLTKAWKFLGEQGRGVYLAEIGDNDTTARFTGPDAGEAAATCVHMMNTWLTRMQQGVPLDPVHAELAEALNKMWTFASHMVEKHGTEGDDTMTDAEHKQFQDAGGAANHVLNKKITLRSDADRLSAWWEEGHALGIYPIICGDFDAIKENYEDDPSPPSDEIIREALEEIVQQDWSHYYDAISTEIHDTIARKRKGGGQ